MFKKGQVGPREMALTLVLAGLLFIVGLLIFAQVSNTADSLIDLASNRVDGETLTITADDPLGTNSTFLAQSGYVSNSEIVVNNSDPFVVLVRDIDYRITLQGASGVLGTRANFTLINLTNGTSYNDGGRVRDGYNASELAINYTFNTKSAAGLSVDVIETTVLDSMSLGVIALIVLAAVVILTVLFKLGNQ